MLAPKFENFGVKTDFYVPIPIDLRREPRRDEKILGDHRQDGNVAVGGIGNLTR